MLMLALTLRPRVSAEVFATKPRPFKTGDNRISFLLLPSQLLAQTPKHSLVKHQPDG